MADRRFKSVVHPGSSSWPVVYGRSLATPIATCLLPVMILTLVGVLEGVRILPYALWGAGAALVASSLWTSFKLRRLIAEIRIENDFARVLSVRDIARDQTEPAEPVYDVKDYGSWSLVTIGLSSFDLERGQWPRYEQLVEALIAAARQEAAW